MDEMIRKADALIAMQRRRISILEQELGKRVDERRPEPASAPRAAPILSAHPAGPGRRCTVTA